VLLLRCGLGFAERATGNSLLIFTVAFDFILTFAFVCILTFAFYFFFVLIFILVPVLPSRVS